MSAHSASHLFVGLFVATLVLTGCGPVAEQTVSLTEPTYRREAVVSDEGSALALLGEGDRQVSHLARLNDPARPQVLVAGFTVIGPDERMTLGAADKAIGLIRDV